MQYTVYCTSVTGLEVSGSVISSAPAFLSSSYTRKNGVQWRHHRAVLCAELMSAQL
jgi:hypothetical protein